MKLIGVIASWAVAAILFWLIFFVAAPFLTELLPENEWKGFFDVVIYILIAWGGGVVFPLTVGILGTVASVDLFD